MHFFSSFSSPTFLTSLSLICIYTIRLSCYTRSHKCRSVDDVVSVKLFKSFRRMLFRLPSNLWWLSGLRVPFLSFLKASVPFFPDVPNEATMVFILGVPSAGFTGRLDISKRLSFTIEQQFTNRISADFWLNPQRRRNACVWTFQSVVSNQPEDISAGLGAVVSQRLALILGCLGCFSTSSLVLWGQVLLNAGS